MKHVVQGSISPVNIVLDGVTLCRPSGAAHFQELAYKVNWEIPTDTEGGQPSGAADIMGNRVCSGSWIGSFSNSHYILKIGYQTYE